MVISHRIELENTENRKEELKDIRTNIVRNCKFLGVFLKKGIKFSRMRIAERVIFVMKQGDGQVDMIRKATDSQVMKMQVAGLTVTDNERQELCWFSVLNKQDQRRFKLSSENAENKYFVNK